MLLLLLVDVAWTGLRGRRGAVAAAIGAVFHGSATLRRGVEAGAVDVALHGEVAAQLLHSQALGCVVGAVRVVEFAVSARLRVAVGLG